MTKVFCIGFHKTGTNSIGEALAILGYRVCGVRHDLIPAVKASDDLKLMEVIDTYEAFKDNPWPILFKKLDVLYPGSKFILTLRDETSWIHSVVNHFGTTPSDMISLIYGMPFPKENESLFIQRLRSHNDEVVQHFADRPQDLLTLHLDEPKPWEKICEFLEAPIPDVTFPHVNKGAYTLLEKWRKNILRSIRGRVRSFRNPDSR